MKNIFCATVALVLLAIFRLLAPSSVHAQSIIFACKSNSDGTLRIVASGSTCKKNETLISWPSVDDDTLGDLTCSAGQTVKFNGAAWVCDPPRFQVRNHVSGVQTFFAKDTGLEWEMKVFCNVQNLANQHCVENRYTWSASGGADGTLFNDFLVNLNDSTGLINPADCYASHCDWRIPSFTELRTIQDPDTIFGPIPEGAYWSSTTNPANQFQAKTVDASGGDLAYKADSNYVRAVRGGR